MTTGNMNKAVVVTETDSKGNMTWCHVCHVSVCFVGTVCIIRVSFPESVTYTGRQGDDDFAVLG